MKTTITFTVLLLGICGVLYCQQGTPQPYSFRSGIVEYKYSGDKTGKSIQYIDDHGMKTAMYSEITQDGETTESWVVADGDYQYMWDPSQPDQGMKMQNPLLSWIKEASKGDMESFTIAAYEKMGMVKNGMETFLGRECTVIKGDMGKVLIWKGIIMLMDFKMGAYISKQEATSVKTNIPVDGKFFIIPKEITFTGMPSL
jgi:hypothetical protein